MEAFKTLLKSIGNEDRENFNLWFYNARDNDLKASITEMNSRENIEKYPRENLKAYIKFAKALLKGALPEPPSNIDMLPVPNINHYKYAKGCYNLFNLLQSLVYMKYNSFIRTTAFLIVTCPSYRIIDSRGVQGWVPSKSIIKRTKPLAFFVRIFHLRCLLNLKVSFDSILRAKLSKKRDRFLTKVQVKKIKRICVDEMIKKGRVNLEQRAFWRWMVIIKDYDDRNLKERIRDDFLLLKLISHNANLRYFQCIKQKYEKWKNYIKDKPLVKEEPIKISNTSIRKNFKLKLRKSLGAFSTLIYARLDTAFQELKEFASNQEIPRDVIWDYSDYKPYLRSLCRIMRKNLKKAFKSWKPGPIFEYEYEEEVTTTTVSKEKKSFAVTQKPLVLFFYTQALPDNIKPCIRRIGNLLRRGMKIYFTRWAKLTKQSDFSLSGEETINLINYRLSIDKAESLKSIILYLKSIINKKQNLCKIAAFVWAVKIAEKYHKSLILSKVPIPKGLVNSPTQLVRKTTLY